jgi:all-trans-retinol dehydrogenase (NAD+)
MIARNEGHIVTIASLAGTVGNAGLTDYSATKSAAYGFTESLRIEMKHLNTDIKVTCINPCFIRTGMFKGVVEPFLWPVLDEKRVAQRAINAIRQNEGEVSIYWLQGILIWLCKAILNTTIIDYTLAALHGNDSVLKGFVGRQGPDDPLDRCKKVSD